MKIRHIIVSCLLAYYAMQFGMYVPKYNGVMPQNTANFTGITTRTPSFTGKSPFCRHWSWLQNSLSSLRNINHLRHWPSAVQCHLTQ